MVCELYLYKAGGGVNLKKQVQIMTQKKKKKQKLPESFLVNPYWLKQETIWKDSNGNIYFVHESIKTRGILFP